MRYLLDTNIISEGLRPRPDPRVIAWESGQSSLDLFVSVLSFGEIRKGVELRFQDTRRAGIEHWLSTLLPAQFRGRILPIDEPVALEWGRLAGEGQKTGRALPPVDGLLIATAIVHGMTLVTRNERDCANRGAPLLNPWSS
ncbi:type II toxin-antitoxin system VapC family toxin [Longimicrobium sp.]|uniref:type II toxin-antitoxin system VapC family toxin n=1 Tax=Longimicrobium sp. TaxID=2029185 RepID=UPI002C25BCFA|nr:type II toxin-antitoxin system VapC family toxin [Longimicrobium sp.]HSU12625.1 type II toxin-antitoxin system VapC family toxin [Longimicrobium sp.]